ncbi:3-dehydroquinate synthase II [Amycolatopsis roodepoortensis]|uniref:3-dehydroquinate synthase II n=1 Tax=Amycolatopsis roodepoortensis TaxID=700274 RepID=UPI00214BBD34|nr:3-dehydroquinate synthase II [Amycolatopsis roodepoortensis]UUV31538.1 3-dehydroquinate synthase II [Amycolatopsis roodepoortensis]
MKFAWIDLRSLSGQRRDAVVDAAVHARVDAVVDDKPDVLATLPPTVRKVLVGPMPADTGSVEVEHNPVADVLVCEISSTAELDRLKSLRGTAEQQLGAYVYITDDASLQLACAAAMVLPCTVVRFRDPTKIPLEIVIAAADKSPGVLICAAEDVAEAEIILDVLEKGSEGVLLASGEVEEVFALERLLRSETPQLALTKLTVESIEHSGLGDRVCVDTCTHFEKDEGILVGSYAHGFILCASETHPLPYMPTRPFRVNAGALHSYAVGLDNRTNYLSELQAGSTVLAVAADGRTRRVVVGRVKLESRPLLTIKTVSEDGHSVSLIVQDDWHVRVLGPGGAVLNVTELKPGDHVLGYLATDKRHVGWPVGEFCIEK